MPRIEITTEINSTLEICFDLARSIDLHKISTAKTNEEAVEGKTSGLIGLNESVTWQATHFGIKQKLTSKITRFDRPFYFKDEQTNGAFKSFVHTHTFSQVGDKVIMKDVFEYQSPFGFAGKIFNALVLTNYMRKFLAERNHIIKEFAESDKWKLVLEENKL
jgi:ligand-binding SRPBCC domain-containing protein